MYWLNNICALVKCHCYWAPSNNRRFLRNLTQTSAVVGCGTCVVLSIALLHFRIDNVESIYGWQHTLNGVKTQSVRYFVCEWQHSPISSSASPTPRGPPSQCGRSVPPPNSPDERLPREPANVLRRSPSTSFKRSQWIITHVWNAERGIWRNA